MLRPKSGAPRGYQTVMPYLRVSDGAGAIRFYKKAFGAKENFRLKMPGPKVGHAELDIGGSIVMLSDAFPEHQIVSPKGSKGTSIQLTLYVDDVDKLMARAVRAGAKVRMAAADQFYGDRSGQIVDPFGHVWSIQTRIEKVAPRDMQSRLDAMLSASAPARTKMAARPAARAKAAVRTKAPVRATPAAKKAAKAAKAVKGPSRKKAARPGPSRRR